MAGVDSRVEPVSNGAVVGTSRCGVVACRTQSAGGGGMAGVDSRVESVSDVAVVGTSRCGVVASGCIGIGGSSGSVAGVHGRVQLVE